MRQLLIPEEACEILRVPLATLYAWSHKRTGPPVMKVGRHLRYDPDDLAEWLRDQVEAPTVA